MTKEELANLLNGREYRNEITDQECQIAKENGLVVVFGASDDLMEFRGAIYDEVGCYDGGSVYLNVNGKIIDEESKDWYINTKLPVFQIDAIWCPQIEGVIFCSWKIDAEDIETAKFDIFEDGELYCQGIVFELASLTEKVSA